MRSLVSLHVFCGAAHETVHPSVQGCAGARSVAGGRRVSDKGHPNRSPPPLSGARKELLKEGRPRLHSVLNNLGLREREKERTKKIDPGVESAIKMFTVIILK